MQRSFPSIRNIVLFYIFYTALLILLICVYYPSRIKRRQRPFYIIGHMVNGVSEIEEFLKLGANVLELDIQFHVNGTVQQIYHGSPCNSKRSCESRSIIQEYFERVKELTDPDRVPSYYRNMTMLFLDLKLRNSRDHYESGRDVARHVLDYLWTNGSRPQEVRVLVYVETLYGPKVITGFHQEFLNRGAENNLVNIGFDCGIGGLNKIKQLLHSVTDISSHIWMGAGIKEDDNHYSSLARYNYLKQLIDLRHATGLVTKVYVWNIDDSGKMRQSLDLQLDGAITNKPGLLREVVEEEQFQKHFRLATILDDPFEVFVYTWKNFFLFVKFNLVRFKNAMPKFTSLASVVSLLATLSPASVFWKVCAFTFHGVFISLSFVCYFDIIYFV